MPRSSLTHYAHLPYTVYLPVLPLPFVVPRALPRFTPVRHAPRCTTFVVRLVLVHYRLVTTAHAPPRYGSHLYHRSSYHGSATSPRLRLVLRFPRTAHTAVLAFCRACYVLRLPLVAATHGLVRRTRFATRTGCYCLPLVRTRLHLPLFDTRSVRTAHTVYRVLRYVRCTFAILHSMVAYVWFTAHRRGSATTWFCSSPPCLVTVYRLRFTPTVPPAYYAGSTFWITLLPLTLVRLLPRICLRVCSGSAHLHTVTDHRRALVVLCRYTHLLLLRTTTRFGFCGCLVLPLRRFVTLRLPHVPVTHYTTTDAVPDYCSLCRTFWLRLVLPLFTCGYGSRLRAARWIMPLATHSLHRLFTYTYRLRSHTHWLPRLPFTHPPLRFARLRYTVHTRRTTLPRSPRGSRVCSFCCTHRVLVRSYVWIAFYG